MKFAYQRGPFLLGKAHPRLIAHGNHDKTKMRIVKETIRYILENYDQKLTLDEIARQVCADKYTLTRIFKCGTGQSIFTFLNSYRCQQAAAMIEQGSTVSDAARQCGFSNMSFFTRTFRQYMGKQPSEYKGIGKILHEPL